MGVRLLSGLPSACRWQAECERSALRRRACFVASLKRSCGVELIFASIVSVWIVTKLRGIPTE